MTQMTKTIEERLEQIKREWFDEFMVVNDNITWLIDQVERAQENVVSTLKERNGKPTVILWRGERFTWNAGTTARGGVGSKRVHHAGAVRRS